MSGATLWWVRHAPTHAARMIGWTDLPADLSDTGALARVAAYLPTEAPIVSSDLLRARATADAIAGSRPRLPAMRELREMHFGEWEDLSFAEIQKSDPTLIFRFWDAPGDVRAPGGECWHDLAARVGRAARTLAETGGDVIVVAHFGAILTQIERALALSTREVLAHRVDNLSVTRIAFDGTRWRAGEINHRP